ncbi:MAG: hypothetical protein KGQ68_00685 [Gammaproteobacteria bacterium]|nr:hypothetical protein [Gammaproteobacteria bacterium]MDE2023406.1 hypothetical protein [Gammaproteobacteria bacterium]
MKYKWLAAGLLGSAFAVFCCALPVLTMVSGVGLSLLSIIRGFWPLALIVLLTVLAGGIALKVYQSKSECCQPGSGDAASRDEL